MGEAQKAHSKKFLTCNTSNARETSGAKRKQNKTPGAYTTKPYVNKALCAGRDARRTGILNNVAGTHVRENGETENMIKITV